MSRCIRLAGACFVVLALLACPTTPKAGENAVSAPVFSPAAGSFDKAFQVTLSTQTEGASIRYTTDGSDPTASSGTLYSAPIEISATTTLKAIAFKDKMNDSAVITAQYTLTGTVATPVFSPDAGSYADAQSVAITCATEGAKIFYTTDDSAPTAAGGTEYTAPIVLDSSLTLRAIAVKPGFTDSEVASAAYVISLAQPITDAELDEARGALARAREVDADYYDSDNFDTAQRLLDEAVADRFTDPVSARQKLVEAKEKADLSFDNSVERWAQEVAGRMETAKKKLLAIEADKFAPDEYASSTAGIEETNTLYADKDYAGARASAFKALKAMSDLLNTLEGRIEWVKLLKRETEQLMKEAEDTDAYRYAPAGQKDKVTGLYVKGITGFKAYSLDEAEESFGAAREAAKDTLRLAKEARESSQLDEKKKADELAKQVMKELSEASSLTVVTEDGTVIKPENWSEEDFLKEIERMEKEEQQNAAPDGNSQLLVPEAGGAVVLADEESENLLAQAKQLWTLGIKEKTAGNYVKAQDYFTEALRYIEIYKSYAVKGVYAVRLIPERRDCLWRIAEYSEVYGNPYLWPKIWRRNRKLIQNPDLIYPGWQLVIPPQ